MSLSLDPLRPYADLLKALAALLLATLLVGLGWYAGAGKWHGKYDVEVAAHEATKAEHSRVLDDLAAKTAAVAAKAKAASAGLASLTPQQFRVLTMVCDGLLNKQIAYQLNVSEATIKAHVTAIFRKLGVRTRTQAALLLQQLESIADS